MKIFYLLKKNILNFLFYINLPFVFLNKKNKNFLIFISSYNNSKLVQKNLSSIYKQTYKSYRIIYVDDNSSDDTEQKAKRFLKLFFDDKNYIFEKNNSRIGSLKSKYLFIHQHVSDNEIIVVLDGDDFFYTKFALEYLNYIYSKKNILATYGSYLNLSGKINFQKKYSNKTIKSKNFRKFFHPSHLRSYYAFIFKKIPKEQFMNSKEEFYKMCEDKATMFPIMELVGDQHYFIKYFLYCYNDINPLNLNNRRDHLLQKQINEYEIRNKSIL